MGKCAAATHMTTYKKTGRLESDQFLLKAIWKSRRFRRRWRRKESEFLNFIPCFVKPCLYSVTPDKTGSSIFAQLDGHSPGFPCDVVKQHTSTRGRCGFTKNHRKRSRSCFDYELLKHPGAKVKSLIKREFR